MLRCLLISLLLVSGASAEDRPNIVFIIADDLGWGETGCYGQKRIPTPHIDRLAARGTRFTRHYSGAPVCAPSRCVLLTGKHTGHAEIRGNQQAGIRFPQFKEGQYPLSAEAVTLPETLRKAGYATAAMGKWGLGPVGSTGDPNRQGFDLFFGYNCQAVAHSYYPRYLWRNDQQVEINPEPVPGHGGMPESGLTEISFTAKNYAPLLMIAEAETYIASRQANPQPFFLFLPFIEPHVAMHPPKEEVDKLPKEWDAQAYNGESGYLPQRRPRAAYAAMITMLDSYVGRVTAALERAGLTERTLIVFTSDNGTTHPGKAGSPFGTGGVDAAFFNSTAGLRGYKGSVYEGGIRVPMIVSFPGKVKVGAVDYTACWFADWLPTLSAAAGLPAPEHPDGENLWPHLTSAAESPVTGERKPMLWVFPEYGGQVAVRIGKLKAVRQKLRSSPPGAWEVYDIEQDPGESRDLASQRPEFIKAADALLRKETTENAVFPVTLPN